MPDIMATVTVASVFHLLTACVGDDPDDLRQRRFPRLMTVKKYTQI